MRDYRRFYLLALLVCMMIPASGQNSFYFNSYASRKTLFTNDAIYFITYTSRLVKCDYSGNVFWTRSVPGVAQWSFSFNSICILDYSGVISRIDTSGTVLWSKDLDNASCGGVTFENFISNRDRIYFTSSTNTINNSGLVVLDSSGNVIHSWCDSLAFDYLIWRGFPDIDEGVWLQMILTLGNNHESCLVHADHDGHIDANYASPYFDYSFDEGIYDLIPFTDSSYLAVYNAQDFAAWNWNHGALFRIDVNGNKTAQHIYRSVADTLIQVVRAATDSANNSYIIFYINTSVSLTYVTMKLDSSFNIIYCKKWISYPELLRLDEGYERMVFKNGFLYCPAYVYSTSNEYQGFLIIDSLMNTCGIVDTPTTLNEIFPVNNSITWAPMQHVPATAAITSITLNIMPDPSTSDLCLFLEEEESILQSEILISPNPFTETITLKNLPLRENVIEVISLNGQSVFRSIRNSSISTIDLTFLPPGVYFLRLQNPENIVIAKLVKV